MTLLKSTAVFFLIAAAMPSLANEQEPAAAAEVPTIRIYPHSVWEIMPPKGVEADGIRRNLGAGDSIHFKSLTITMDEMIEGDGEAQPDRVTLTLEDSGQTETRTAAEATAFIWNGYRIAIVALHAAKGELGHPLGALEIATAASLPEEVRNSTASGGPEWRLRVPHKVDKLTLHHSATSHKPGDDLAQKLRNMQAWGESDRQWWDLPYHYMIDLDGTVYQARDHQYVGDTNTRYNPAGHFLVNCFGNYSEAEPNEAQLASIANLFAWAAKEHDMDTITIFGHRDLAQTGCPGDNLYRYIEDGSLKKMVEEVMEKGQPKIEWLEGPPVIP